MNFILCIRSKCGQGGGGHKYKTFADIIYGSSLTKLGWSNRYHIKNAAHRRNLFC